MRGHASCNQATAQQVSVTATSWAGLVHAAIDAAYLAFITRVETTAHRLRPHSRIETTVAFITASHVHTNMIPEHSAHRPHFVGLSCAILRCHDKMGEAL